MGHCCIKHGLCRHLLPFHSAIYCLCHFIQGIANVNNMMTLTFTFSVASMLQRVATLTRADVGADSVAADGTGLIVDTGTWLTVLTLVDVYKVA